MNFEKIMLVNEHEEKIMLVNDLLVLKSKPKDSK